MRLWLFCAMISLGQTESLLVGKPRAGAQPNLSRCPQKTDQFGDPMEPGALQ
jgi:hypothetical protein